MNKCLSIVFVLLLLFSCSGGGGKTDKGKEQISLNVPTQQEVETFANSNSSSANGETIKVPNGGKHAPGLKEECDGLDNNENGLIDEGCYGCCPDGTFSCCPGKNVGDFDCDGTVTMTEAAIPTILPYGKTTMKNNMKCADINNDGKINMEDTIAIIKLINRGSK